MLVIFFKVYLYLVSLNEVAWKRSDKLLHLVHGELLGLIMFHNHGNKY